MPNAASSLFKHPCNIGRYGSPGKRVDKLRRVTDVVVSEVDRPNEEQIGVFGARFLRPVNKIEAKTPAKIGSRRRRGR